MLGEVHILLLQRGRSIPFERWLAGLKDKRAQAIIRIRLNRVRAGNFGDARAVGSGVEELRIDFGPGYRVYFGRRSAVIVVLLGGGSKRSQTKDIACAQEYWKEYLNAEDPDDCTVPG